MLETVMTKYGPVQGVRSNAGYALFRGVPYAKPPVGELRWKAPEAMEPWDEVRVCDQYGPACMQFDRWSDAIDDVVDDAGHSYVHIPGYPYPPAMSEDCLYLNIYTPAKSGEDRLPVCFYIHGGGLQQWYGSDYEYCGDAFCREGCIVVSITYRLNVFGYYSHPELDLENEHHSSGNYGLLDQIKALEWVYENIAAFGGDPDRIMCFGQSAGGGSTLAALASPLSKNYIRRVSMQSSNGLKPLMPESSKAQIQQRGIEFMKACGCETIAQMRALSAEQLRDYNCAYFSFLDGFALNIDGYVLPDLPSDLLAQNKLRDVEMIVGCTADEGAGSKPPMFGFELCSSIAALGKKQNLNGRKPIYSFVFSRVQPGDEAGVPHSCDNRYQFGTLDGCWRPYTEEDWKLSEKMTAYWANFARTGDPNGEGLEQWDAMTVEKPLQMKLDIGTCHMHDFNVDTRGKIDRISEEILAEYQ